MPYLIDTGILLRLLNRADPQHADMLGAIKVLRSQGDRLHTSTQNIAEFWNACTRPSTVRGGYGLSVEVAARRVRIIERLFPVLPDNPNAYAEWKQLVLAHRVMGVKVHDAKLVALMMTQGLTHILTVNKTDFKRFSMIAAVEPKDLLESEASGGSIVH